MMPVYSGSTRKTAAFAAGRLPPVAIVRKILKKGDFTVRCDTAFEQVMARCAESAPGRQETWINDEILRLFVELHHLGITHSIETWIDGDLVGGLYGLSLGSAFFGESMFSRVGNASKVALAHLVARLREGGLHPRTRSLSPNTWPSSAPSRFRRDYLQILADAIGRRATFYGDLAGCEVLALLSSQSITQMS